MSAVKPPAPLGSLALNTITQAGLAWDSALGGRPSSGRGEGGWSGMGPLRCVGWRKSGNQHRCLDTIVAFYVKAP
ncbi:hypothetical protein GCM10027032_27140 [Simplicispira piscis]